MHAKWAEGRMNKPNLTRREFLKAGGAMAAALVLSAVLPQPSLASTLVDPYAGVVPMTFPIRRGLYWIYRNWHVPRVGGVLPFNHEIRPWLRAHDGIDVYALRGTPLYATVTGTVVEYPRPHYPYGNYVWIQNDAGYRFFYCHLDKLFVKPGQAVETGTVLGTVGKTGNAATTPAHLHFEIHYPPGHVYACARCPAHRSVSSINPYSSLIAATPRA
jgi:murein DD-endopeptidase MepM/ murein hydrolase activator NlpD